MACMYAMVYGVEVRKLHVLTAQHTQTKLRLLHHTHNTTIKLNVNTFMHANARARGRLSTVLYAAQVCYLIYVLYICTIYAFVQSRCMYI